jgi:dimethylglycine catabolism A
MWWQGGNEVDDAVWFGLRFGESGADYLSVSKGGRFEDARQPKVGEAVYPYTGESGSECMPTVISDARGPFGRNVRWSRPSGRASARRGMRSPS